MIPTEKQLETAAEAWRVHRNDVRVTYKDRDSLAAALTAVLGEMEEQVMRLPPVSIPDGTLVAYTVRGSVFRQDVLKVLRGEWR